MTEWVRSSVTASGLVSATRWPAVACPDGAAAADDGFQVRRAANRAGAWWPAAMAARPSTIQTISTVR